MKAAFYRAGGVPTSPETIDREVHGEEIDFVRTYLARYVPGLASRCLDARVCIYTNTPDLHFVISLHPDHPQVAIACGFSGHGYKSISLFAPARLQRADARG